MPGGRVCALGSAHIGARGRRRRPIPALCHCYSSPVSPVEPPGSASYGLQGDKHPARNWFLKDLEQPGILGGDGLGVGIGCRQSGGDGGAFGGGIQARERQSGQALVKVLEDMQTLNMKIMGFSGMARKSKTKKELKDDPIEMTKITE